MSCCREYNGRVVSQIGAALAVLGLLSVPLAPLGDMGDDYFYPTPPPPQVFGIVGVDEFLGSGFSVIRAPIWSGVTVFITGCLGLKSGKQPTNKCAMAAFLTLAIISTMTSLVQWLISAWAIPSYCTTSWHGCDDSTALHAVHLLLGLAECALCLTSSIQCCVGISTVPTLSDVEENRAGLQLDGAHLGRERTAADSNKQVTGGGTEPAAVGTGLDATEVNVTTLADVVEVVRAGLQLDAAHRGKERTAAASNRQNTGGGTEATAVGTGLDATEINVTTLADVVEVVRAGLQLDAAHRGKERTAAASNRQNTGGGTEATAVGTGLDATEVNAFNWMPLDGEGNGPPPPVTVRSPEGKPSQRQLEPA
ncbi:Hypp943 [Branchiostoma lanceolatum]|uniref:Hypp943 protein n=1 Tax=Branchiostoma lanceolatum TaxID=7740 RepID=A0A8J9ZDE8_BRALA|nr:Hypp943 [Branchiostoma lanceolatum]